MNTTIKKLESLDYVQFHFTTIFGDLKSVEFPAAIWDDMLEGTGVDGSSLGFLKTEQSDLRVLPDMESLAVMPWDTRVGRFICDVTDNDNKPHTTCSRSILKKVIAQAKDMGFEYKTRPELEWYFLNEDNTPADTGGYMDTLPYDSLSHLRRTVIDDLREMGIGVKTIHHENGPGQQEFEFTVDDALKQSDNVQTAKMITKTEAAIEGVVASFMAKPLPDEAGSGLHIHQYLTKNGENIFADPEEGVSEFLVNFVGGIMEHVDAMTTVLNPTTNSYKRLVPGYEAPVYKSWGVANRTALIRIPGYEKQARVEYRAPDCSTNIYLASALLLAAGLDGVRRKLEPNAPTRENVEKMSPKRRKELGITQLPASLGEALEHMEKSSFVRSVLGNEMVEIFIEQKQREMKEYNEAAKLGEQSAHAWEMKKYRDRA
ncbi:MAG: glutamine synthetase family protein [Candidatus Bathyarchaeota archaeon]|nr:glutamine synthetase family protein [Candidatus Bathyarchaeota archaeon]